MARPTAFSPFDLLVYLADLALGLAAVHKGRHADAANALDRAVQANPTLSSLRFIAASAHALTGHADEAKSLALQGLTMEPAFSLRLFFELMPRNLADMLAEGGRSLGLPE